MKVLFCSSEVAPFAKTGGLADVSGALPQALEKLGCQVKVALPKYRSARGQEPKMGRDIEVYLIENERLFDRDGLYGEAGSDYPDNLERFVFFCQQTLKLLKKNDFAPEIIHCNDWQSALIPVYLQTGLKRDPFFKQTKTIFTIHNLAYQGLFAKEQFPQTGLDWQLFNTHALEFYGKFSLLKGGLIFSRFITTVSPTYAKEVQGWRFGHGLDGVLRERKDDLVGILNGVDYAIWDPAGDEHIFCRYDCQDLEKKSLNKEGLQKEVGLPLQRDVPLIGMVGRLAEQKGIELVAGALKKMSNLNLQFVLLGTGDIKFHQLLEKVKQNGYRNISIELRFDPILAHKIYAGSDLFLMPSAFEPCGLGQLISFKYGTIPIVRKTGGLKDTVSEYQSRKESGNGFVFENYSAPEMLKAIKRAVACYQDKEDWRGLMQKVMRYDFSWKASAEEYFQLYQRAINE
jgi:starch synthase